jgi:hypothetical protein
MDYNEGRTAAQSDPGAPIVSDVREVQTRRRRPSSPGMHSGTIGMLRGYQGEQRHLHIPQGTQRTTGYLWTTKIRPAIDIPDRHELFLLADGERKIEMETVTRKSMRL